MYFQIFYHILSDYGRKNSKFYDGTQMEICYCTQTGIFRTENFAWSWGGRSWSEAYGMKENRKK